MEELIDVLDENGIKTGRVLPRSEIHKKGLWHKIVVTAIINSNNEILMQQRSYKKIRESGMWDISVAGHVSAGENTLDAAVREIEEEIGIKVNNKELEYIFSYSENQIASIDYIDKQIHECFILKKDNLKVENINIQESEVEQIKFVSIDELRNMIRKQETVERDIFYNELIKYIENI